MVGKSERKRKIAVEEVIIISAVLIAGLALQFFSGPFDKRFLAYPVNLVFLGLLALVFFMKKGAALSRMASVTLSVILLAAVTIAALWMGLVPGNMVKVSWPFVLLYLMLLVNLTAITALRLKSFSAKQIPFILNHVGLLVLLFSAGPGSADKSRFFMTVMEGSTEWRGEPSGTGKDAQVVELPLAIELVNFSMEEYPPKLGVVDKTTGEAMPLGKPHFFEGTLNAESQIARWEFRVDSIVDRPRYAPAAYVLATEIETGTVNEGWVTCGNYFQHFKILDLTENLCVAMTFPEPKSYTSNVKVYTPDGQVKAAEIEVNSPMTVGNWKIYQFSYDTQKGKDSEYSVFELVYDPWVIPLYIGFIMMLFGAITLFWKGGKK
jgi:hypothetical protein